MQVLITQSRLHPQLLTLHSCITTAAAPRSQSFLLSTFHSQHLVLASEMQLTGNKPRFGGIFDDRRNSR